MNTVIASLYIIIYVMSCVFVIVKLSRARMYVASCAFAVVFTYISFYLPYAFGSQNLINIVNKTVAPVIEIDVIMKCLNQSFIGYLSMSSFILLVFLLPLLVCEIILSVRLTKCVIEIAAHIGRSGRFIKMIRHKRSAASLNGVILDNKIYLRYCRLLS